MILLPQYDFLSVRYPATHTGKGKSSVDQSSTVCFKNNFLECENLPPSGLSLRLY